MSRDLRALSTTLSRSGRPLASVWGDGLSTGEFLYLACAPAPSAHEVTARCARAAGEAGSRMTHFFLRADDATVAADFERSVGAVPGHLHSGALRASLAMRACDEFLFVSFELPLCNFTGKNDVPVLCGALTGLW